ncbi:uncharacterized protein [Ptychodera flava]|uniref:uncharacterized protein n=1 Tax=Ptychodera flava TaxID=63121 RepID=UPI003969F741
MILIIFLTLTTLFIRSAAQYYYCPAVSVYNHEGQCVAIGQPNHYIYVSEDNAVLLNSSVPFQERNHQSLCIDKTNIETKEVVTLGCTGDSRSGHEVIAILGYYMMLVTDHAFMGEKYTWWFNDTGKIVAASLIEKLPQDSKWKISIWRQRPSVVIHQFEPHAKDVAINFEDSQTDLDIAIAWLENGTAFKCHVSDPAFRNVLFLTANASYVSVTFSSEFSLYGNYRMQVTYTNNFVSNYSLAVVQDVEASSDHTTNTLIIVFIVVSGLVLILLLSLIAVKIQRHKRLPKPNSSSSVNGAKQKDDHQLNGQEQIAVDIVDPYRAKETLAAKENVAVEEPQEDDKLIDKKLSADGRVKDVRSRQPVSPRELSQARRSEFFGVTLPDNSKPTPDFRAADQTDCVSSMAKINKFNDLLVEISDEIDDDEFVRMKHFLSVNIPRRVLEKLNDPFEVFDEMKKRDFLSVNDTGMLENLLYKCGRADMQTKLSTFNVTTSMAEQQ